MKWTKDQERVITERDRNILVSAAAGSGKTAVLTERIIRLLKEGADIRKFLVITFTNASASDMKEKIRKALSKEPSLAYQLRKLSTQRSDDRIARGGDRTMDTKSSAARPTFAQNRRNRREALAECPRRFRTTTQRNCAA